MKENEQARRTIPNIESRIVRGLTGVHGEVYRDPTLWYEGSRVFHAYLYPLGTARPTESHSADLMRFFGFNNVEEYQSV